MATSGSYSFNLVKTQIITRALQLINKYALNATPSPEDYSYASDILNMLIKHWETNGINLWKRRQATLFPTINQNSYQLGSVSGADNVTNTYVNTTLSSSISSGVSSFVVDSSTGFVVGMNIGLEQDDNSRIWGTITDVVGTTITTDLTTTTTSAAGNTVVAYTSKINRPLEVIRATNCNLKNNNVEASMMMLSFDQYFNLPIKTSIGIPNNAYYDRVLNNSLPYTGTLYLFPQPSQSSVIINFTYQDGLQDMLNASDTPDFPQEWLMTLIYNLAVELGRVYGKQTIVANLEPKARELLQTIKEFDNDMAPLSLLPNLYNNNPNL